MNPTAIHGITLQYRGLYATRYKDNLVKSNTNKRRRKLSQNIYKQKYTIAFSQYTSSRALSLPLCPSSKG